MRSMILRDQALVESVIGIVVGLNDPLRKKKLLKTRVPKPTATNGKSQSAQQQSQTPMAYQPPPEIDGSTELIPTIKYADRWKTHLTALKPCFKRRAKELTSPKGLDSTL